MNNRYGWVAGSPQLSQYAADPSALPIGRRKATMPRHQREVPKAVLKPGCCLECMIMTRSSESLVCLVFAGLLACVIAHAQETALKAFRVEPDTFYRLSFETEGAAAPDVRWVVHQVNGVGELLFDGCLEAGWQHLRAGESRYRHDFLTVDDAAEVRFSLIHADRAPALKSVSLEQITVTNLVLNGDFALGAGNQSGWNEMLGAAVLGAGGTNLLQVNQNGYALSDCFPVADQGGYTFVKGAKTWPGVAVLAFDRDRRQIDRVPYAFKNRPPLQMPAGAAYARLLFTTSHDHIPAFCTNRIVFTGLVPSGTNPPPAQAPAARMRAAMEIVVSPQADPREVHAARELRHWIEAISGKTPALLARPSAKRNVKLQVGLSLAGAFGEDLAWLKGTDGYAVRSRGGDIFIFGAKPRGTLFGVHALLERNSDIIWPRPNPDFEAVFTPDPGLTFTATDFRSRPVFALRHISMGGYSNERIAFRFQDWMARNGLNTDTRMHRGLDYLVWQRGAPAVYGTSHIGWLGGAPDGDNTLYPLVDGTRSISRWRQPCYTHPDTVPTLVAAIRAKLALLPDQPVEHIHSIIADNWSVCACARCMQPIRLPDGSLLKPQSPYANKDPRFFSTRNFIMLNAVAEALAKDFPDLRILTHAYIFTAEPPKVPVHPNIIPQFAAYPTQNARYPILAGKGMPISDYTVDVWKRRFTEWGLWKPDGLGFFGYYYTPGFNALADTAAADFRDLARFGGVYVHTEGFPVDDDSLSTWDVDGAEKWIMARLMWDPALSAADLRDTYIRKVYREAAPRMRAFHALIGKAWHDDANTLFVNCHSQPRDLYEGLLVKPGNEQAARALLVEAVAAARHPQAQAMVRRTLAHFDQYRESLGRQVVPQVEEARQEWNDAVSPHWEKALALGPFKKVDDWRRFEGAPADHRTEVRFMHDGEQLFIRVVARDDAPGEAVAPPKVETERFPNGDRFELVCRDGRSRRRYFAAGLNGNRYADPKTDAPWRVESVVRPDAWIALIAIPLSEFHLNPENFAVKARVGRVYRLAGEVREESTPSGTSLYNEHDSFWMTLNLERRER